MKKAINILIVLLILVIFLISGCVKTIEESEAALEPAPTGSVAKESVNEVLTEETDPAEKQKTKDPPASESPGLKESETKSEEIKNEETKGAETKLEEAKETVKEITMTAKRFKFIPSTITVNEGDKVKITITSIDVVHGFSLPDFGVNERLNPNRPVIAEFVADKTGTFIFRCNIPCGSGHGSMIGTLVVE